MTRTIVIAAAAAGLFALADAKPAQAQRHYYGDWSYNTNYGYHYCNYYYKPTVTYTTYTYHYAIYYPSRPSYVYYYNPQRKVYWGRYELGEDGKGKGYSLLAEADRREKLEDIPEEKFPEPAEMPEIPGSDDAVRMLPPPTPPKTTPE